MACDYKHPNAVLYHTKIFLDTPFLALLHSLYKSALPRICATLTARFYFVLGLSEAIHIKTIGIVQQQLEGTGYFRG